MMYTFSTDERFLPIVRLFIHKRGVETPRLVGSFPNKKLTGYMKERLEKGMIPAHVVWEVAAPPGASGS